MTSTLLGLCPICTESLQQEGSLVICPSGDYEANAKTFLDRWGRYFSEVDNPPTGWTPLSGAEELLADLQKLNRRRKS